MKNLIILSLLVMPILFACSEKRHHDEKRNHQEIKAPDAVENACKTLYPDVKYFEWNKEGSEYEAEFEMNEKEMSASFDSTGKLIETEVEINIDELPASIKEQLSKYIANGNIKEASKITDAKGNITYEAEFKKDLLFSADGKSLNESEGEKIEVPEVVENAFKLKFKDIENVKWGKEGENFEAEFEMNDVGMSANFDMNGNLLETETEISIKDLPEAIRAYVSKNLSGAEISEAAKIINAKGETTFEAEVNGKDYIFDQKGKLLKSSKEENDND